MKTPMLHLVKTFTRKQRRVSAAVLLTLTAVALGLSSAPSASAATVPAGMSASVSAVACGSIVNLSLTNNSAVTQRFWLRQPITDHSFAWVDLVAHSKTVVQKANPTGTGVANWAVITPQGAHLASINVAKYSGTCYTGNFLPSPTTTATQAAQIYTHCGSEALITLRNNTTASPAYQIYRYGALAPPVAVQMSPHQEFSLNVPVVGQTQFIVKSGATVLTSATVANLSACVGDGTNYTTTTAAQDQFNGTSVDLSKWWIYNSPNAYPQRDPAQVSESDGELKLTGHVDPVRGVEESGGIGFQQGQMYGHWEVRFKYDAGQGYRSAILLWPDNEKWPENGEIDMSEIFDGPRGGETEFQHNGPDNAHIGSRFGGDFTQWHTVGVSWLPGRVVYYMDGQEVWSVLKPADPTVFSFVPSGGTMHLALQNDTSCSAICTNAATPANVTLHIDWMKDWAAPASVSGSIPPKSN